MSIVILAVCWGDGTGNNDIGIACTGEFRNAYKVLFGELKGKRPFGNPSYRTEDSVKVKLYEAVCIMAWDLIELVKDRVQCWVYVNVVMKIICHRKAGNFVIM